MRRTASKLIVGLLFMMLALNLNGCGKPNASVQPQKNKGQTQSKGGSSQSSKSQQGGSQGKVDKTGLTSKVTGKGSTSNAKDTTKQSTTKPKATKGTKAPSAVGTTTTSGNPTGTNVHAAALFSSTCQVCHGVDGKGASAPSLNSGLKARFSTQAKLASFIQSNMPFNRPGSLTMSQASALARYLWSMQK